MCVSKTTFYTLASICDSNICVGVRPYLGQWYRYVITCKTMYGTLALCDICDYPSVLSNSEWFIGQRWL
ncbi:Putative helicase Mov10l1 [Gossypium arboreum]|uniref:Putative helicase Mov10l1 n=1 Tax=Gossypium arboreum TaxID=29729 RepID=A0A0B0N6D6_GOSAR|nr:Putative helicase Mov10l1 [Gossypium arboreum]